MFLNKMRRSILLAILPLAMRAKADIYPDYEYGNMFYLGPTTGGQYITKATWTLVPPSPPTDFLTTDEEDRWLSLWIGLQDNPDNVNVLDINFVQPLINWAPDNAAQGCSADIDHWCVAASTYTPSGQIGSNYVAVPSGATLDFEVAIDSSGYIDQTVWMNGQVVATESDSQGMLPAVFYSGTECYDDGCGDLAAYTWTNITLVLNEADADLSQTMSLTGAVSSGMETSDNGKTWTISSIEIEAQNLTE